jgi:protein-L-isoaspartate(D-aspartate) O-methyltransferase
MKGFSFLSLESSVNAIVCEKPMDGTSIRSNFDFAERRRSMVDFQLRRRGISNDRVLKAMSEVPREKFVSENQRDFAYDDMPLPIGHGQTISQPFTVAFMCEALLLKGTEKVLEIGAGSGYSACVLSLLAQKVFSLERIPELAERAKNRVRELGYENVDIRLANGTLGLPEEAPFDAIVVTAGAEALPNTYLEQTAEGGRIVIPIGSSLYGQSMFRFTKKHEELQVEDLGSFAFVPLIGRYGWHEAGMT